MKLPLLPHAIPICAIFSHNIPSQDRDQRWFLKESPDEPCSHRDVRNLAPFCDSKFSSAALILEIHIRTDRQTAAIGDGMMIRKPLILWIDMVRDRHWFCRKLLLRTTQECVPATAVFSRVSTEALLVGAILPDFVMVWNGFP
jgi:hypothetical protein